MVVNADVLGFTFGLSVGIVFGKIWGKSEK
jgi:hypothetical protein